MDITTFEAELAAEGYSSFEVKELAERPTNALHTHPADYRILVLEGSFGLTFEGGEPTFYGPREQFSVLAGQRHQETFPPGGARWTFGQRTRAALSAQGEAAR